MSEELKKLEELLANDRKIIEDNYKEIERLKKREQECMDHYLVQCNTKEIERLNNIINELEKYLDEALDQDMYRYDFKIILDKLHELKGEDKE